jgi:hypothetical protein
MSLFIEVESVEKNCKVMINLDTVMEVAPLTSGGCEISFPDQASVGGRRTMKVKDNYSIFQQLAMQLVSSDALNKKIENLKAVANKPKAVTTPATVSTVDIPRFAG